MEMQMTLEVITPETAKKLLEYNTNNRVPRRNNVAKIADDIENGRWKVTGETIKFSDTRLIDGQNRLMAVVQAGRPIKTWVARNVDDEAFAVCDTGVTRTPADILNIAGHKHAHVKSTAVKIVRFYMDRKTDISTRMSTQKMLDFVDSDLKFQEACDAISTRKWLCPKATACAFYYLAARLSKAKADQFMDSFYSGANLEDGDAILALRNTLVRAKQSRDRHDRSTVFGRMITAWNHWLSGKKVSCINYIYNPKSGIPRLREPNLL